MVVVRRRTDRILGTGFKKNLSDLPNPMVTCPLEDRSRQKGIAVLPGHAVGYKKKAKALRVLPSGKASKGVFYSSAGLGATVGY